MIELPMLETRYEPSMPRNELQALTKKVLAAKTLARAVAILKDAAKSAEGAWKKYMLRLVKRLGKKVLSVPPMTIFTHKGNPKLSFYAFSAIPGETCPGAGECLKYCYSFKSWRNAGSWARQVSNTLLLKFKPSLITTAFAALPEGITLRLYVDGDFDSEKTVAFWFGLLKTRPDIEGYGYSKSWDLIWEYGQKNVFPANYLLNLSNGGSPQRVSREAMSGLSITRGEFIGLKIDYPHKKMRSFARYKDPEYHRALRKAATDAGLTKVFSCPGICDSCAGSKHACGSKRFRGIQIVNGVH